jgi:regulator of protease activity HflC (stomatin/prohibitin superfamily)
MKMFNLIVIALLMIVSVGCSKVPVGNVGIKVYLLGGEKGVDHEVLGAGKYWIGVNEELYIFPTFSQNYVWEKEGGEPDESLTFGTAEGLSISADLGITYAIQPDKVALVFQKYRKGVDEITDIYLRNMVRDALVKAASTRGVETIYGAGKAELIEEVEKTVRNQVKDIGIIIERVYWVGDLRLPPQVTNSINAKIQATQISMQRENEVKTAEAQAAIEVAQAKGQAEAKLTNARAEAESLRIQNDALKQSTDILELRRIEVSKLATEKWDGKLPTTMVPGSAMPFINVGK